MLRKVSYVTPVEADMHPSTRRLAQVIKMMCVAALAAPVVTVTVSSPANNVTLPSPVHFVVSATSRHTITAWRIYVDSTTAYQAGQTSSIDTYVTMSSGAHQVVVRAWNSAGNYGSASLALTIPAASSTSSASAVSLSPTSFNFGSVNVGSMSTAQYVTITNTGTSGLSFTGAATYSGGFQNPGGGTCYAGVTYAPGQSCTIGVQFAPRTAGTANGTLTIYDNALNSPQAVALAGTGVAVSGCTSNCYYISPSGDDSNSGTSASSPWKTFAHAIPLLRPGYTLLLENGTYGNAAGTGLPSINCSSGAHNGTAAAPVTIQAQNERQAFIQGDGSGEAFNMVNCSYWNAVGLHVENADNGSNTSSGDVMQFYLSDHLTIRRNIAARPNRCANTHTLLLYDTTNSLVEENEVYYFFRWGILVFANYGTNGGGNEIRRNYANRRNYPDSSGVCTAYNNGGAADFIGPYYANNNTFENNFAEDISLFEISSGINDEATASNNTFLGNVAGKNMAVGFRIGPHGGYPQSTNNTYSNNVSVLPGSIGVWSRSTQSSWDHQSVFGSSSASHGMLSDTDSCCSYPSYQFVVNSSTVQNFSTGYGYQVSHTANNTFSFDHDNNYNNSMSKPAFNARNYQPNQKVTNSNTSNPSFGSCYLWVPAASSLKGAGVGRSDIGANVLYQYQGGALTSNRLWSPTTGAPLFGGVIVAGLNDIAGQSLFDIANRLNINQNGCVFPVGY